MKNCYYELDCVLLKDSLKASKIDPSISNTEQVFTKASFYDTIDKEKSLCADQLKNVAVIIKSVKDSKET